MSPTLFWKPFVSYGPFPYSCGFVGFDASLNLIGEECTPLHVKGIPRSFCLEGCRSGNILHENRVQSFVGLSTGAGRALSPSRERWVQLATQWR